MYFFIFILLCITSVVSIIDLSLYVPQYPVHSTFDCTVNIINSATDVSVLIVHFDEENINHLLTKVRSDFTIFSLRKNETTRYRLDLNKHAVQLIIIRQVEDLNIVFKALNLYIGGKTIVLNLDSNESREIFQTAWSKYIINICVIYMSNGTSYIDTYFPYENDSCGENISVTRLGKCQNLPLDAMFPNKVPLVFPGCEIRVVANLAEPLVMDSNLTVEDSRKIGIEAVIFKNLLARMNLTQKLITTTNMTISYMFPNGTIIGPHIYLAEGKCDLLYGQKWTVYFLLDYFDNTYTHYIDALTWHVPLALLGQQWTNIFLAFDYLLWLSVLVMLFCMILVVWVFGLVANQPNNYSSWGLCSLNIWYMLLVGSVQLPTVSTLRILVFFWTVFALILTTSYQSQLLSFLMKPVYERQISTVDELLRSSLDIPLVPNLIRSLQGSGSPRDLEILKKGRAVSMEEIKDMWLNPIKNTALYGGTSYSKYVAWKQLFYYDIKPTSYIFKDSTREGHLNLVMHTVKGFPLINRMDDIILRTIAAGLNDKWQRDIEPSQIVEETELRVLTVGDIRGAFIILILGCLIALVTFIIELLICKVKIIVFAKKHDLLD